MAGKLNGNAIVSGSITAAQLAPGAGGGPKITSVDYPGNASAVLPVGGETVTLVGTGFDANMQVYLNSTVAPSVSFANANSVSFTTPALSVGQYILYAINGDGGSCLVPNFEVSGSPTWVTTSPLTGFGTTTAVNIQLSATSDSTITYSLDTGSSLPGGLTLSSSGLISGTLSSPPVVNTTYNFTVVATDEEFQASSRAFSVTAFASASFNISPAVSGLTTWNTAVNGPLVLDTNGVWTITPSANMSANIVMWGAGGGGGGEGISAYKFRGGGGGSASGIATLASGQSFIVRVGQGGRGANNTNAFSYTAAAGGGGASTYNGDWGTGSGGAYTGIFAGSETHANSIMIAGGGGGGGVNRYNNVEGNGGPGGGTTGGNGFYNGSNNSSYAGGGGTQSAGGGGGGSSPYGAGQAGGQLIGGTTFTTGNIGIGAGGGSGYYGGGSGTYSGDIVGAGGGGSGYANPALTSNVTLYTGNLFNPGNNTNPYFSNCGVGGNGSATISLTIGTSGKFVLISGEIA